MAPPANRRSGYSRRAQYTTFFGYIAGVLGALVGALLLVISIINPSAFAGLRGLAADAAEPAGEATASTRNVTRSVLATIAGYFTTGSQNARLRRELQEAKIRLIEAEAISAENRRLKALLGLASEDQKPVAYAKLTYSSASSTRRFATLGAGAGAGVAEGMPVRSVKGLIGRVLETGHSTARILLITDTDSIVPVRRSTDDVAALAQGRGDGALQLRLINLGINPIKPGDVFVTSGSGGLYRPGTPVAVVSKLTSDGAIARVLSDPVATDYVAVETVWTPKPEGAGREGTGQEEIVAR